MHCSGGSSESGSPKRCASAVAIEQHEVAISCCCLCRTAQWLPETGEWCKKEHSALDRGSQPKMNVRSGQLCSAVTSHQLPRYVLEISSTNPTIVDIRWDERFGSFLPTSASPEAFHQFSSKVLRHVATCIKGMSTHALPHLASYRRSQCFNTYLNSGLPCD